MPVRAGIAGLLAFALAAGTCEAAALAADLDPRATSCEFYVAFKLNPAPSDYGPALPGTINAGVCLYVLDVATFPVGPFTFKAKQSSASETSPESAGMAAARPGPPAVPSNPVLIGSVTPPVTIKIGETAVLSQPDSGNGNLILAQGATLGQPATIQSLSFYVTTAAGNLRLGIYDATGAGGLPGAKRAETASFVPVVGWNTAPVTTPISLPAGSYWLVYLPSSSTLAFRLGSGPIASRYKGYTFGPMPATFPSGTSSTPSHWSFYATFSIP